MIIPIYWKQREGERTAVVDVCLAVKAFCGELRTPLCALFHALRLLSLADARALSVCNPSWLPIPQRRTS